MKLSILLCSFAGFFLATHLMTLAVAAIRCRPRDRQRSKIDGALRPVTVVRPLYGVERFSAQTIDAAFELDYPSYELLFCVADPADPVVPLVEAAMAAHPDVAAKLLIGDDKISINPKLNNMVKGWREAAYDWIVFIDSNVLVPPHFLTRLVATFRPDTGVVSAPPCGIRPDGFGAHVECAFLNTYEARWQYFVDTFGNGFAQGKTLFYRKADLDRSSMRELASEPAEDAATTKMVRRNGQRVRLAPPSPQPLGIRPLRDVWGRQLRWARLRRATFPVEFYPEILSGAAVPACTAVAAVATLGWPIGPTMAAYFAIWYGAEIALARSCGWPVSRLTPFALLLRDVMMPALWVGALTSSSFTWNGTKLQMEPRSCRRNETAAGSLQTDEGV